MKSLLVFLFVFAGTFAFVQSDHQIAKEDYGCPFGKGRK